MWLRKPNREASGLRGRVFLSAEWRNLLLLNYETPRDLLLRFVPPGTEPDSFGGKIFASLVGFQFLRTRLAGLIPIPFHAHFEEVNLRLYVRRRHTEGDRRGVVFIREIVPRLAIAKIARWFFGENYSSFPMSHSISLHGLSAKVSYRWKFRGEWCGIRGESKSAFALPTEGSLEQFITEHYWGYSAQASNRTLEYRVAHPPWSVRRCDSASLEGQAASLYGMDFAGILSRPPDSAFLAQGSAVDVWPAHTIS
jgi:uncharacterized protein